MDIQLTRPPPRRHPKKNPAGLQFGMGTKPMIVVALFVSAVLGGAVVSSQESAGASTPVAARPVAGGYIALNGGRIYDSRGPGFNLPRLAAGQVVTVATGQPGASAVGVNITLTETVGAGFVAAWTSGPWPGTSIMNSSEADENVANFAIIPVAADGTFQLMTQNPAHLIVDIMGVMMGGVTATITRYSHGEVSTGGCRDGGMSGPCRIEMITWVGGTVLNASGSTKDVRVTFLCPEGEVTAIEGHRGPGVAYVIDLPPGASRDFTDSPCLGTFTSGASVTVATKPGWTEE